MQKPLLLLFVWVMLASSTSAQSGNIGIGTNIPDSRLQLEGSLGVAYRTVTSSTTLGVSDYAIEFTGSSAAAITLPDATTCKGRIYTIKNNGTGSTTPIVTITPYSAQTIDGNSTWALRKHTETNTLISNGTNWNVHAHAENERTNYVLVKSVSDFPAPVSGVITLTAGTLYEINGTILVSSKINLNDCTVLGKDRNKDILVYTAGSGELFTGSNGGSLMNLTILASAAGTKVFNLDAGGAMKNLLLQLVYVFNSNNIGTIKGFDGWVILQSCAFSGNMNGFVFQDIGDLIEIYCFWLEDNQNTYQTFVGAFDDINISGGEQNMLSAFSAKALDISGITSMTGVSQIKNSTFSGDGTYVVGSFSNQWAVESMGVPTEKDDVASGNIYVTSSALTSIITKDVPVKIAGTTTALSLFRVTMPANNKLTYTGFKTKRFQAICSVTSTAVSSNTNFSFHIYKNGVKLPESTQSMKLGSGVSAGSLTLSCTVSLTTNDYIEVWVENNTDNSDLTADNLNLSIK